jgi:hypothetical protein
MDRRAFLSISAGVAVTSAAWAGCVEPTYFELTHTKVRVAGKRQWRVLHVADIHMSDGVKPVDLENAFESGLAQKPDLICLTGDFVSSIRGFDQQSLFRILRRARSTAPTYAVLGNHDNGTWLPQRGGGHSSKFMQDLIRSSGVHLLHNESAALEDLTLVGMADLWSDEFDPERAFAHAPRATNTLLLCHNPDGKDHTKRWRWDLMLSGHTHGGQVRVPGITPYWAPVSDKRFIAGLYEWEDRQLFITRGIGSPRHVRAFCRPEISILDLV